MFKKTGEQRTVVEDVTIQVCDICGKDMTGEYPSYRLQEELYQPNPYDGISNCSYDICSLGCLKEWLKRRDEGLVS